MSPEKDMCWKVHVPNLFKEMVECNPNNAIFRAPLMITKGILAEIAERAVENDDAEIKLLCCRLALYEVSDPDSPEYDPEVFDILKAVVEGVK